MNHALKIEELEYLNETDATSIVESIREFMTALGYSLDRISNLECRSRDGFMPYSHNLGGLEAIAFKDQCNVLDSGGTGFANSDATLEKYEQYDIEYFEELINKKRSDWNETDIDAFYESRAQDEQASVLYSLDVMYGGKEDGMHKLNLRFCICVKDAPYHRKYDDKFEFDIEFRNVGSLKNKLAKLLKEKNVKLFASNLSDAF